MITSLTSAPVTPARASASLTAVAPRSWAGVFANAPLNDPTAVRVARQGNQWVAETVWENENINGRMSNAVLSGDVVFGLTSRNSGQYYAVDAETGTVLWISEGRQASNVAMTRAGEVLFSLQEDGELVILRASQTGFEPLRRYTVAEAATWAHPAISGNRIFVKDVSTLTLWTVG